ncbi:hypothetical protein CHS0354_016471 [Potamilus streckersoni]|uniref:Uncharacterized protein n=1 Tax=Potamilus streckersoni TaxID=2493646 RepID=A0AAE0TKA9_9BIVA|nr:hypothetical protein CHS0354_016471 [Potamilus streckersoni]
MSRISSTFGKQSSFKSSQKSLGGVYLTEVPRAIHSPSPPRMATSPLLRTRSAAVRKSTGSIAASLGGNAGKLNKSIALDNIEAEYIKNLQQQIYFLELESNYLREQARKATDMHPQMTNEAECMLSKLRQLQSEMDSMTLEMRRKDDSLDIVENEKGKLLERLKDEEDARARDKRMLMDEIIQLKKNIVGLEGRLSEKDGHMLQARDELEKSGMALRNAEVKITSLKSQLEQRVEQHKMTQIALDEKRSELLSVETQLKSLEEKYYNSTVNLQDKVTSDLRDEIRVLRQRLKEAELAAEQERHLRAKVSDDSSQIVRENAVLNQQVIDLEKQLERERNLREENEARHSTGLSNMLQLKDKEKEARFELEYIKEQLRKEQEKCIELQEAVTRKDSISNSQEQEISTARKKMNELTNMQDSCEKENIQLRRDKSLLVDHVADLQKKLDMKNEEVVQLRGKISSLEGRLQDVEELKSLETTIQSQKWGEFERLAENMRTLSSSMARPQSRYIQH